MTPFPLGPIGFLARRARSQEVWLFTQRLRRLITSGMPEAEAVRAILDSMPEGRSSRRLRRALTNVGLKTPANLFWRFSRVLRKVLGRLENGCSLSEAFSGFPKYFPPAYVAIVATGERSGELPEALKLAGESLRRHDVRMDRVLLGVMIPVIAVGFAYLQLRFLARYVWPKFIEVGWGLEGNGFLAGPEPSLTWVMHNFLPLYTIALLAVLFVFGAVFLYPAIKSLTLYRFCLLMDVMLRANLPVEECRRLCKRLSLGSSYQNAMEDLFSRIAEGKAFAAAVASIRYFPRELKWIVAAGQYGGNIPGAFSSAADVLSNKSDIRLARLLDICPPLLTILTAIPVGFIAFATFSFFRWITESMLP